MWPLNHRRVLGKIASEHPTRQQSEMSSKVQHQSLSLRYVN